MITTKKVQDTLGSAVVVIVTIFIIIHIINKEPRVNVAEKRIVVIK
jgi:hypothetical protein